MAINAKWGGWASSFDETNLLGEVVAFEANALSVPFTKVQTALIEAGMDPAMAREIVPARALRRAVAKLRTNRIIGEVEDTNERIVFQFTKARKAKMDEFHEGVPEWVGLSLDSYLSYEGEGRVVLDKATGGLTGDSAELLAVVQELLGSAIENRTTSDITTICNRSFKKFGDLFPLRKSGGCYFVPAKHSGLVDAVAKFLEGVGACMRRYPVAKGHLTGENSVRDAIRDGLQKMLADHVESIERFETTTRDKTMAKELDEIKLTRFKIDAYAEYLQEETDQLKEKAAAADKLWQQKVEAVLEEREADGEEVPTTPICFEHEIVIPAQITMVDPAVGFGEVLDPVEEEAALSSGV